MGNIRAESAYCPYNAQNDYGYPGVDNRSDYVFKVDDEVGFGLCQWTVSSRKQRLLNHAGDDSVWSFDVQMSYLHWELQNMVIGGTTFEKYLKNLTTLKDVAEIFMTDFEGPKDQSSTAKELRVRYAQEAYEAYASQTVSFSMTHSQLSGNTLTLSSAATAGDFSTLSVTSNTSWTATLSDNNFVKFVATDADSATIHNAASASGAAGETLKLRIQIVKTPNAGSTSSATMTVRVGGEIKAYTITQTIPGTSSEAAPTITVNSVSPTTLRNTGNTLFKISFTAKNMSSVTFKFNGIKVDEAWDHDDADSPHKGYQNQWTFGSADIGESNYSYTLTTWTVGFYPEANTVAGQYSITITAYGNGGNSSTTCAVNIKECGTLGPKTNSDVVTTSDSSGNIVIDFSTKSPKVVTSAYTKPYYYLDEECAYPSVDNLKKIINQFDVDGQGYKFQSAYRAATDPNRGFYERTPDGSTYCTWYLKDVCYAAGAPWTTAGYASSVNSWAKTTGVLKGWVNLGTGSSTVLSQAVFKANEGYLVVGTYPEHVFLLYPAGSSTAYISQAGAQNNRCNTQAEINTKAQALGVAVNNSNTGKFSHWLGSIRSLSDSRITYFYWPGN